MGYRVICSALVVIMAAAVACSGGGGAGTVSRGVEATSVMATPTPATIALTSAPATAAATPAPTPAATTPTPAPTMPTAAANPPAGPLRGQPLVSALRGGGYVLYFRHAITDQVPDDSVPVDLEDCGTQRNLSTTGRDQAQAIGRAIADLQIPVGRVLSSPFCRALDTARLAFGTATPEPVLENLETVGSEAERETRIGGLRRLLSTPLDGATNTVLVAHGNIITAAAGVTIPEGGGAVFRPEGAGGFTLVATVTSREWEDLVAAP